MEYYVTLKKKENLFKCWNEINIIGEKARWGTTKVVSTFCIKREKGISLCICIYINNISLEEHTEN